MLPQAGSDIKGHKRSTNELRAACGYDNRKRDFDDLIRILDSELRLITPADISEPQAQAATTPETDSSPHSDSSSNRLPLKSSEPSSSLSPNSSASSGSLSPRERVRVRAAANDKAIDSNVDKHSTLTPSPSPKRRGEQEVRWGASTQYQLTHDYLVPSLRDWLTRKQRETRRGRAELKLAERAETWNRLRENRQLPNFLECLTICLFTDRKKWTELQCSMMKRATKIYFYRSALAAIVIAFIASIALNHLFWLMKFYDFLIENF